MDKVIKGHATMTTISFIDGAPNSFYFTLIIQQNTMIKLSIYQSFTSTTKSSKSFRLQSKCQFNMIQQQISKSPSQHQHTNETFKHSSIQIQGEMFYATKISGCSLANPSDPEGNRGFLWCQSYTKEIREYFYGVLIHSSDFQTSEQGIKCCPMNIN